MLTSDSQWSGLANVGRERLELPLKLIIAFTVRPDAISCHRPKFKNVTDKTPYVYFFLMKILSRLFSRWPGELRYHDLNLNGVLLYL